MPPAPMGRYNVFQTSNVKFDLMSHFSPTWKVFQEVVQSFAFFLFLKTLNHPGGLPCTSVVPSIVLAVRVPHPVRRNDEKPP